MPTLTQQAEALGLTVESYGNTFAVLFKDGTRTEFYGELIFKDFLDTYALARSATIKEVAEHYKEKARKADLQQMDYPVDSSRRYKLREECWESEQAASEILSLLEKGK